MEGTFFKRCGVSCVLAGVMWLGSMNGFASSLTVCDIADGDLADTDGPANGSVTATCEFPKGSFTGAVTETTSPSALTYSLIISGSFYGSAQDQSFVTGQFSLAGIGDVYPYIYQGGKLASTTPNAASTGEEFLAVTAFASNQLASSATARVIPPAGALLPVEIGGSLGNLASGKFSGSGTLSVSLSYQTGGSDRYFSLPIFVQASTDPNRVVPESSTVLLVVFGIAGLLVARLRGR